MRIAFILVYGLITLTLAACGGSSAPPAGQAPPAITQGQVGPGPADVAAEPEIPEPPPEEEIDGVLYTGASAPVVLPFMNPELYEPGDSEIPDLLLFNIRDGAVVHHEVLVTATGIDDTGVNFIALLIDGSVVLSVDSVTLTYNWITNTLPDGAHLVEFVVRDNGNHTGVLTLEVEVDNSRLWDLPDIEVVSVRCTSNGTEYLESPGVGTLPGAFWVTGEVELEFRASSAAGPVRLSFYYLDDAEKSWNQKKLLVESPDGALTVSLDSTEWTTESARGIWRWDNERDFRIVAEDPVGNTRTYAFYLLPVQTTRLGVSLREAPGQYTAWDRLALMPQDWEYVEGADLAAEMEQLGRWISYSYGGTLYDVPLGRYNLVMEYQGVFRVIPVLCRPAYSNGVLVETSLFDTP